jgi:3-oxoacyl-[acyl-carrier-protein] synthase-3
MISIEKISSWIPTTYNIIDNYELIGISKLQSRMYSSYFKLCDIPIAQNILLEEMIDNVLNKMINEDKIDISSVKYVIYSHSIQGLVPYGNNILKNVLYKYGLKNVNYFGSSINKCATNIVSLDFIDCLLNSHCEKNTKALLICADKSFSPETRILANASISGDVASINLISKNICKNKILAISSKIFGEFSKGGWGDFDENIQFEKNFINMITSVIFDVLKKQDLTLSKLKFILPHNINVPIWNKISEKLEISFDKVLSCNINKFSHCFTSDFSLNFEYLLKENKVFKNELVLAVSVGYGLSIAALIIKI